MAKPIVVEVKWTAESIKKFKKNWDSGKCELFLDWIENELTKCVRESGDELIRDNIDDFDTPAKEVK